MGILVVVLVVLAVFVVVGFSLMKINQKPMPQPTPSGRAESQRSQREVRPAAPATYSVLEDLLQLQLDVREKMAGPAVLGVLEPIIDDLGEILPRLTDEYKGSELTFTATQMAKSYLPKLLQPWLKLPPKEREERLAALLNTLQSLKERLAETVQAVRNGDVSKFDVEAQFLKQKFS